MKQTANSNNGHHPVGARVLRYMQGSKSEVLQQDEALRAFIRSRADIVDGYFTFWDLTSTWPKERLGYERLLKSIRDGDGDVVLVTDLERLGNVCERFVLTSFADTYGVRICTPQTGLIGLNRWAGRS